MKRIIYFTSKTCAPCKVLLPKVEELVAGTETELVTVDIDENPAVARTAGIAGVPTILFVTGIEPLTTETNRLLPTQARITNIRKKLGELNA